LNPGKKPVFSSRWALILATLGMAIGTGNLWRFPRILAANGGGTFLIPWALFLFTWSIPLLMVEFSLGRATQKGPLGAFAKMFGERTGWRGGFIAFCTLAIMFYYSVVSGWTLRYLWLAVSGGMETLTPETAVASFESFTSSGAPMWFHLASIGLACVVVMRGVTTGIERACKVLVPTLFVVLIIAAVRGLTLDGAGAGIDFLTTVDWSLLGDAKIWLEALSQSAWSTGAGWGLMICYAVYASSDMRAGRECVSTGVGNNAASLLAALAIIPATFALAAVASPGADPAALVQESGPANTGLTFIWMPVLFQQLPWGGGALSVLFFLALAFAALSSMIAMVELGVRSLVDLGWSRPRATGAVFVAGFLLGVPSAIDLPFIDGHTGLGFFGNQDWVWGVGLIVSGGLAAFSVIGYGVDKYWIETIGGPEAHRQGAGGLFRIAVGVLVPVQFVGLLAWWFKEAYGWTGLTGWEGVKAWLNPMEAFSVGTCLVQWALVLVLLKAFNKSLARRSAR